MSRTCGECGSTWDGRASFCGRCGGLLDERLASVPGRDGTGARGWRRPWVGAAVVAVVVGAAVAAVPRLSIERTPPVDGEIGEPEEDDLNAAPASARIRDQAAPPPEISCTIDGTPVACVRWSRAVLPAEAFERGGGWVTAAGDEHVVAAGEDGIAVFDADTGTRLWRDDSPTSAFPADVSDRAVLFHGPTGMSLRDLDDGTVLWSVPSGSSFLGVKILQDVVVQAEHTEDGDTRVRGQSLADGTEQWRLELPGALHVVGGVPGDHVLLEAVDGSARHAVVDAGSGELASQFEVPLGWLAGSTEGMALFVSEHARDPADPNLAGDGGATLTAVRLDDGAISWTRELPSAGVGVSIAQGTVLTQDTDRAVAVDVATGAIRWEADLGGSLALAHHGSSSWWGPGAGQDDWSTVAIVHDQVDDLVRAHDLVTGEVLWERLLDDDLRHVAAVDGVVMVDRDGGVTLLDPATGDERVSVAFQWGHVSSLVPLTVIHPPSGHAAVLDTAGVDVR